MRITVGQYHSHVRVVIVNDADGQGNDQGITLDIPIVQALMLAVSVTAEVSNVLRGMLGMQQQAQQGALPQAAAAQDGAALAPAAEQKDPGKQGDLGSQAQS